MLRRVYSFWQPGVIAFACVMMVACAALAQEDAGAAPKPADEQEPPVPAESQEGDETPADEPAAPEAKPDTPPAAKEDPAPEPADAEEPKADEPAPADTAEPVSEDAPEDGSDPAGVYAAKLVEWKELLKQLRTLRTEFVTAEPDQVDEMRTKWDDLMAQGETLLGELREAAVKAFLAAPNADGDLAIFLSKIVADSAKRDDFEPAAELSQTLFEGGYDQAGIYEAAGIAAFATNDYEKAELYLNKAKESGFFDNEGQGQVFLAEMENYKQYWAEEQELRKAEAEQNDLPRVRLTTSKGDILLELFENEAPGAVGNFISLVEKEFYDGLTFHRVLPTFMAQGGCPEGTGTGGPGYNIYCECNKANHRKHFRGTLSMAHAGPNTGGSQFFITFVPTPQLNGKHTAFGRVVAGMDVLAKIQRRDPDAEGPKPEPDKIVKAEVVRKREHEYVPDKAQ